MPTEFKAEQEMHMHFIRLGIRLKAIRDFYKLDEYVFANLVNATPKQIIRWEKGLSKPRQDKIKEINEMFNLPSHLLHFGVTRDDYRGANRKTRDLYNLIESRIEAAISDEKPILEQSEEDLLDNLPRTIELTTLLQNPKMWVSVNGLLLCKDDRLALAETIANVHAQQFGITLDSDEDFENEEENGE